MTFLLNVVIGFSFWSSSTVLGNRLQQNCGHGGSDTKIVHKDYNTPDNYTVGYVIHPRGILTVAHRVKESSPEDLQIIDFENSLTGPVRDVSKIYIHPNYNPCEGSHDFAILTLRNALPDGYSPICLISMNLMNDIQVHYHCSTRDYYYSKFYESSDTGDCSMILSNFDPREVIKDPRECSLKKQENETDAIKERITEVHICNISLNNDEDYREYYEMHTYNVRWCEKDRNNTHRSNDGVNLIANIDLWIENRINDLIKEDDQPYRVSLLTDSLINGWRKLFTIFDKKSINKMNS